VSGPIRLFFIDDHPVIASGLAGRYENVDGFAVVGTAASVKAALASDDEIDIVVVDFQLDTPLSPRQLAQLSARGKVVVFSARSDDPVVQLTIEQGAWAVVNKAIDLAAFDAILRDVFAGVRPRPSSPSSTQSSSSSSSASSSASSNASQSLTLLSERELDVYRGLVNCQTPKEIAASLGIARSTVYCHIERIRQKLGLATLQEIVAHGFHEAGASS
jgi:DNA-binding NarL/FixJ family response regulator